jgi:hypothetical protein
MRLELLKTAKHIQVMFCWSEMELCVEVQMHPEEGGDIVSTIRFEQGIFTMTD